MRMSPRRNAEAIGSKSLFPTGFDAGKMWGWNIWKSFKHQVESENKNIREQSRTKRESVPVTFCSFEFLDHPTPEDNILWVFSHMRQWIHSILGQQWIFLHFTLRVLRDQVSVGKTVEWFTHHLFQSLSGWWNFYLRSGGQWAKNSISKSPQARTLHVIEVLQGYLFLWDLTCNQVKWGRRKGIWFDSADMVCVGVFLIPLLLPRWWDLELVLWTEICWFAPNLTEVKEVSSSLGLVMILDLDLLELAFLDVLGIFVSTLFPISNPLLLETGRMVSASCNGPPDDKPEILPQDVALLFYSKAAAP